MPKYDLAVVGAGLGGLAAAALASAINKKTIVLEPGDAVGGNIASFHKDGFSFCSGPRLSFGFERGGIFQQLGESLGIALNGAVHSPCYQVALPDRRITVYAEQSETLDELSREFPDEIDAITKFYRELRKQSLKNAKNSLSAFLSRTRSARAFISSHRFSREFTAFLDAQSFYFFGCSAAALPRVSLITLCDAAPFTLPSGFKELADQLLDVLLKNGAEIRYKLPLNQVTLKKGGLSLPEGGLEADCLLINTPQSRQNAFLCLALREDVVPVGMLPEVICVPDYSHPEHFFTLSMSRKSDPGHAPSGMRALTAEFRGQLPQPDRMQHVRTLIPFLDEFLLFVEDHTPAPRSFGLPDNISVKRIKTPDGGQLLGRITSSEYILFDGAGTPGQSIAAARRFLARIK